MHTYTRACIPSSEPPLLKSSCIKGSCLLSHFISIILLQLTRSRLCHFTHFFLLLIPLCFSFFVSRSFSFSPLLLSALPTCQGDSPPKRTDVFYFIFIYYFWRVHFSLLLFFFFEMPLQRIHITGSSVSNNLRNLVPPPPPPPPPPPNPSDRSRQPHRLLPHFS